MVSKRAMAYGIIAILFILEMYLLISPTKTIPLSITEVSCSGSNIWIKYSLEDEGSRLQSLISDCNSNPAGGWVGNVNFEAISPNGRQTQIGGYQASAASTQKINCGVTSQSGKTFAGWYIPNDGQGVYQVTTSGTYYLSSDNYTTPHSFSWTDGQSIACVIPATNCNDGTAVNQCSAVTVGKFCAPDGYLRDRADKCGCPSGYQANGYYCTAITTPPPPQTYPPTPTGNTTAPPPPPPPTSTNPPSTTQPPAQGGIDKGMAIFTIAFILVAFTIVARRKRWI